MSFTSNLYRCKIIFDDYTYNSVEHAYQASKTIIPFLKIVPQKDLQSYT